LDNNIICHLSQLFQSGKKLEESSCRVILVVGPSLENWDPKPSGVILMNQTMFFGVEIS
jgi:hypothetical protein